MSSLAHAAGRTAWQWIKILLSVLLIAYGVFLIVPRLNEVASTDAVITARALMVRAPEAGTVTDAPRTGGGWIKKGDVAAKIDTAGDPVALRALETEGAALAARLKALEDQYNANETLRKTADGVDKRAELLIAQASIGATLMETRKRFEIAQSATDRAHARPMELKAPVDGFVWRALASQGSQAAAHAPIFQIIDASNFFADCSVHRDDVQYIQPGAKVSVKILGQTQLLEGVVETVLSPVSYDEQVDFAVAGPRTRSNEYRVLVRLPPIADRNSALTFGLGVRATVVFGHRVRFLENLLTLSR